MRKPCVVLILGVLALPHRAEAQGFIIPEMGSRVNGMGAAVGRPDDLSAIYHNPAALASLPGTQVMAGVGLALLNVDVRLRPWEGTAEYPEYPEVHLRDPQSGGFFAAQSPLVVAPMPMLGASTKLFSEKLVAAVGVYVPNAAGASFGEDASSRYHIIEAHVFSAFFTGALAYQPWRWLSVGVGASAVYIDIHRRSLLYPVIEGNDLADSMLGENTELIIDGSDVKPAFSLGIQVWPHRTVSLGFMMLSRYDVSLEGPLRLKPGEDASPLVKTFAENQHRTEIVAPWIFGFGANWDITPWLEIGAEFRLYLNSLVQEQVTTITNPGVLQNILPDGKLVTPKNLRDSFHTGGGVLVRPPLGKVDLELMSGFHFDNAASPDNTVEVSAPSFDLLVWHVGARWRINDRYRVAAFYAHYWYFERDITGSITFPPTNFVGSGFTNMFTVVLEGRFGSGIGVGGK